LYFEVKGTLTREMFPNWPAAIELMSGLSCAFAQAIGPSTASIFDEM
jgi:hypothetical protein